MDTHTRKYRLPDHGYTLVRWAHELAKGRGAVVVEPDVEGIRRPDGALTFVDAAPFKTAWQGPLSVLRELLDLEAREIRAWSKTGFARFHRVTAARRVDRICRERGSEAAVDWVLANATAEVNIGELRDRLGARLYHAGGFDEDYYRAEVGRCIEHRRRRHLNG
ncbi:hypothetical protein MTER_38620 [Mycolicibacter terrae]|uniref:Uncharacterized protein n=1 Tax=Mycolicibacter terrae TaxID=1788 RepID=A0AAD1I6C6_9MYCO|nr:hypothetical protein [Mycolicibacter terrae]ORW93466.1 hypothetical protein AWC28_15275 [Mycolicibacter terrae]BBX24451.1 hypothetical protein MTER_38620 [Mycolicibacter terrae]SNV53592.1 Uncharacterised protein [Mycolicibacter terrae]